MTDLLTPTTMAGRTVTPLGLGTARLGAVWQRRGLRAGLATVHTALDLGVTLVDTADCYARGISERIVGRAVGDRDDVVVMTKVGLLKTPLALRDAAAASGRRASLSGLRQGPESDRNYHPDYLRSAARACLRRQGREVLDVLLLHEPGAGDLTSEVAAAMEGLVADGLVRQWGASVRDVDAALAAIVLPGLSWLQVPVNAGDTSVADALADHPGERDVAVIALGALGDGTLLPRATSVATPPHAIAALTEAAAAPTTVDGVLLGMSTPEHAVANISALQAGTPPEVSERVLSGIGV